MDHAVSHTFPVWFLASQSQGDCVHETKAVGGFEMRKNKISFARRSSFFRKCTTMYKVRRR